MRKCYAWFLLLVSTTQWVGGHICFEVAYLVEHEALMSEPEQTISAAIYEKTGIVASVNIVPEGQQHRMGTDYGNYFVFTDSDSTGTVSYTVDYGPKTVTWEQVAGGNTPQKQQGDASKTNLLKQLFSEFMFPTTDFPRLMDSELAVTNFLLYGLQGQSPRLPLSQPPDAAC